MGRLREKKYVKREGGFVRGKKSLSRLVETRSASGPCEIQCHAGRYRLEQDQFVIGYLTPIHPRRSDQSETQFTKSQARSDSLFIAHVTII